MEGLTVGVAEHDPGVAAAASSLDSIVQVRDRSPGSNLRQLHLAKGDISTWPSRSVEYIRRYVDLRGAPSARVCCSSRAKLRGRDCFVVDAADTKATIHLAGRAGSAICPRSERTIGARFTTFVTAVMARPTSAARRRAIALGSSRARRVTATAFAVALLMGGVSGAARSAPPMCADVLKSIEKRLADGRVQHPPLKIVPKNLSTGYQVVGTCEGGTQRIVHDVVRASAPSNTKTASKRISASKKP